MSTKQTIPYGRCQCGCGGKTRLAPQTDRVLGWAKGEPIKRIQGHQGAPRQPKRYVVEDRGFATPCWMWRGGWSKCGYGRTNGDDGRLMPAHKYFYERDVGPVPDGMAMDHLCRVRACVNPAHLEPVTTAENNRRGNRAKLNWASVDAIRAAAAKPEATDGWKRNGEWCRRIAAKYGISVRHLRKILDYEVWKPDVPQRF